MAKLVFDAEGQRFYENGVSKGVLFTKKDDGTYDKGVVWNGLTAVNENPTGGEPSDIYADNIKYLTLMSVENFEGSIEAYTYPDEFAECDGSKEVATGVYVGQQKRRAFAMCYRSEIGNDVTSELGYKLHFVYGALASPSEKNHETINDNPEAATFSWDITTTPIVVNAQGVKPTAHLTIDSTKVTAEKMQAIEDAIYGTTLTDSKLLTPDDIIAIMNDTTVYTITTTVTNGTYTGATSVASNGSAQVQITANEGYVLPENVTVTGASSTYNSETGIVSLTNATDNVVITAVCVTE